MDWVQDFLCNRFQRVRVGCNYSSCLPVSSGVIQGSVLGPTLFNIFMNDIDQLVGHSHILKYADDLRIFLESPKEEAALTGMWTRLQQDIDNISQWIESYEMA